MAFEASYASSTSCSNWSSDFRSPGVIRRGSFSFSCSLPMLLRLFRQCQFSVETISCASRLAIDLLQILAIAFRVG